MNKQSEMKNEKQDGKQTTAAEDLHEQHLKSEQQSHKGDQRSDAARAANDGLDDRFFSKSENKHRK